MAKKILIVDDEPAIVKGLSFSLKQDGYEIDAAYDGEEAIEKFNSNPYDLIILDVMLPKLNGLGVLQRIRERSRVPVIMLTAKGEDMDKILGLDYGADDYITKPFNILELKARIKALFRRLSSSGSKEEVINFKNMEINLANRSVLIDGKDVNLTAKEFDLLQLLPPTPERCTAGKTCLKLSGNMTTLEICGQLTFISAAYGKR